MLTISSLWSHVSFLCEPRKCSTHAPLDCITTDSIKGFPYKFVGKVKSRKFQDAPWVILETRTQLNFFSRLVLGDQFPDKAYNEELTFAYLEGQKIKVRFTSCGTK